MPAELAAKVATDPATIVRGGKVYVEGVESGRALAAAKDAERQVEQLAAASVVVSAAKGSDYWYGVAVNTVGQIRTVVYLRYSWSWMWWLRDHWDYINMLSAAACAWLPGVLSAASGSIVAVFYLPLKNLIQSGLNQKKCIRIRMAAPPLADMGLTQLALVTCRV
ncbi:hypothetical protein [Pedococcus sp. P5_B7]